MYVECMELDKAEEIYIMLGMPISELPFRYLGVSHCHKKLTISQCSPSVEAVSVKVKHCTDRFLYYAGMIKVFALVLKVSRPTIFSAKKK